MTTYSAGMVQGDQLLAGAVGGGFGPPEPSSDAESSRRRPGAVLVATRREIVPDTGCS